LTTSFEKLALLGRLGADAELRYTPQGLAVLTASVAIERDAKDGEAKPIWRRVTVFGEMAVKLHEAGHLRKGTLVYAEGRPEIHEWDGTDGAHRVELRCIATKIEALAAFQPTVAL
jgi:single-strand DNA-binding protein